MSDSTGLTSEEKMEIADQLGGLVTYFVAATADARRERDRANARAERAERELAAYKRRDDVRVTDLAAQP